MTIIVLIWVIMGAVCAYIAGEKGRSAGAWFFLGACFGIFALIAIACVPVLKEEKGIAREEGKS